MKKIKKIVAIAISILFVVSLIPHVTFAAPANVRVVINEEYVGNGVRRLVFAAQSDTGFTSFNVAFTFDNSIIVPVVPNDAITGFGGPFPFYLHMDISEWAPSVRTWASITPGRTGVDAGVTRRSATIQSGASQVPIFAFYYRLAEGKTINDKNMDTFRILDGRTEGNVLSVLGPLAGIIIATGGYGSLASETWHWGSRSPAGNNIIADNQIQLNHTNSTRLPRPHISLAGSVVEWSSINGANGYRLYIDGLPIVTVNENSVNLSAIRPASPGENRVITVVAIGDNMLLDSLQSNELTYRMFMGPRIEYTILTPAPGEYRNGIFNFTTREEGYNVNNTILTIEITNTGDLPLQGVTHRLQRIGNMESTAFTISTALTGGVNILPGSSVTFSVAPVAGLNVGVYRAAIVISSSDTTQPYVIAINFEVTNTTETLPNTPPDLYQPDQPPMSTYTLTIPHNAVPTVATIPTNNGTVTTNVRISGNQTFATLQPTSANINRIVYGIGGTVSFDFRDLASVTTVNMQRSLLHRIANVGNSVKFVFKSGTVYLSTDAAMSVVQQSHSRNISISLDNVDANNLPVDTKNMLNMYNAIVYNVTVQSGNLSITDLSGIATIIVPFNDYPYPNVNVWGINSIGELSLLQSEVDIDTGTITFSTEVLDLFTVISAEERSAQLVTADILLPPVPLASIAQVTVVRLPISCGATIGEVFIDPMYNRTMAPLRTVIEIFGGQVRWISETRSIEIIVNYHKHYLAVDTPLPDEMGVPVIIIGRTFVPIRYVAELLGAEVRWDRDSWSVYIYI